MKRHAEAKFDILKCEPQICKLIRRIFDGTIDVEAFPFIGEAPKRRVVVGKGGSAAQNRHLDASNTPRIFTYIVGGMSHNEIVEIDLLQKEIPAMIVPGSNEIISSWKFSEQMANLGKKEAIDDFKNRIMATVAQVEVPNYVGESESTADLDTAIN